MVSNHQTVLRGHFVRFVLGMGTGASGATGAVGEMRGIIAVPPWSRQAGGEADGGEEGVARGGAQRGESDGEAEMA